MDIMEKIEAATEFVAQKREADAALTTNPDPTLLSWLNEHTLHFPHPQDPTP